MGLDNGGQVDTKLHGVCMGKKAKTNKQKNIYKARIKSPFANEMKFCGAAAV